MIEQIQKLKKGSKTSRKQLKDAMSAYDLAYYNRNTSDDARRMAEDLLASAARQQQYYPTFGENKRANQRKIYEEATRILNGNPSYNTSVIRDVRDQGWGDRVINSFYEQNNLSSNRSEGQGQSRRRQIPVRFDTNYYGVLADNADFKTRMTQLAHNIISKIEDAESIINNGGTVIGMTAEKLQKLKTNVQNALFNYKDNPRELQNAILNLGQDLHLDQAAWDNYFGTTDDLTKEETNKRNYSNFQTTSGNTALDDYMRQHGLQLAQNVDDSQWYIVDTQFNTVKTPETYIGLDPSKSDYDAGFAINNEGRFYITKDNEKMFSMESTNPFAGQVAEYIKQMQNRHKDAYSISENIFDRNSAQSDYDILNNPDVREELHGKYVIDLSSMFGKPVIAGVSPQAVDNVVDKNTKRINLHADGLTLITLSGRKDERGKEIPKIETYADLKKNNILEDPNYMGNRTDLKGYSTFQRVDLNIPELLGDDWDLNPTGKDRSWKWGRRDINIWGDTYDLNPNKDASKDLYNNAKYFVYLYGMYNSDRKDELTNAQKGDYNRLFNPENELKVLGIISRALQLNPNLFNNSKNSEKYRETWQQMLTVYKDIINKRSDGADEEITTITPFEKNGGVLKASTGTVLDMIGSVETPKKSAESYASKIRKAASLQAKEENRIREEAATYGRTVQQQKAGSTWTRQDTLRAAALATDIGGLIAAISGAATYGVGSVAAIGAGIGSTIMDTIADFTDDSISRGQAWKNLGLNLGLTAGAAFGAKAPKILKSAIKLVPRIMMAAGTMGIVFDKEVHNTIQRMTEGKSMNMQDWRNIMMVLRMSTGIATAGTQARGVKKAAKRYEDAVDTKLKNIVTSQVDENVAYVKSNADPEHPIALDKKVLNEVKSLLAKGKKDDAIALLSKSADEGGGGLSTSQVDDILSTTDNRGWKFWKANEQTTVEDADAPTLRSKATPEQLAQAELEVMNAEQRRYNAMRNKHKLLAWADDHSLTGKLLGLDPSNSLIMTQALAANGMTNKKGDFSALRAKKQGIVDAYNKEHNLLAALDSSDPTLARADAKAVGAELKNEIAPLNKKIKGNEKAAAKVDASIEKQQAAVDDIIQQKESVAAEIEVLKNKKTPINQQRRKELGVLMSRLNKEQTRLQQEITDAETKVNTFRNSGKKGTVNILRARKDYQDMQNFLKQHYNKPGYKQMIGYNPETGEYSITTRGSKKLAAQKVTLENAVKVLDKAKKSKTSGYAQYEEAISAGRKARSKFKQNASVLDPNSSEQKELSKLIADDKNFRATRDADLSTKQTELANLEAKLPTQQTALEGQIASRDKILGKKQTLLDQRRSQANQKRLDAWASQGRTVWNSNKSITVTTATGNVEVGAGTKIKSFAHLRNESLASNVAKHNKPDAVILTPAQIKQLLPKSAAAKVRGALYDPTTKEISIWNQGGSIESKYSYLRK